MNKEELLQKELDNLIDQFEHVGINLNKLSYIRIACAIKHYAIAMCEEQKRQDVNSCRDRGIYFDPSIILKTKNVAE